MGLTDFSGITAVITGGASGIGLATAQALYEAGANVVLADINEQGLRAAEACLRERTPGTPRQVICMPTDVTRADEVRELMETAVALHGRLDLVVTCAGIGRGGPLDTFAASEMQRLLDINVMGTFHCLQQALPAMRRQGSGHFVCLSSIAGKLGTPFLSGYCASKWAVRGLTSAARAELTDSGIGITTVYPAWVETPMIHQENEALPDMGIQALLTADQVAEAILQAVLNDERDLTLVPNPDIRLALQLYTTDPALAEQKMGRTARQGLAARTPPEVSST